MEFPCRHCGHTIRARDEFAGEQVVCVACGRMTEIPQPSPMPTTDPQPPPMHPTDPHCLPVTMAFHCDHCGNAIPARGEFVGEQVVCARCERVTEIPEPPPMPLTDPAVARAVGRLLCPWCQYRLQGLLENRCPECGRRFDPHYLIATGWGQTRRLPSSQLMAVGFAIAVLWFLVCSGILRV
jgi:DNA-directed RNA polymerase subunit M/transcription elongation factor TFIIS